MVKNKRGRLILNWGDEAFRNPGAILEVYDDGSRNGNWNVVVNIVIIIIVVIIVQLNAIFYLW